MSFLRINFLLLHFRLAMAWRHRLKIILTKFGDFAQARKIIDEKFP
ncbi:hypothetical protein EVA_18160 [gut metagenome]|uniref:Uncharacterized protein n=1 Tax=gut metagenome TaxID=749906 RepID=J9FH19_9ZZZZ